MKNNSETTIEIACPACKHKTTMSVSNSYRPFCSERCKIIDLDEWFLEKKYIVGENISIDEMI